MSWNAPIRVIVCDDSYTIRAVIARILRNDPGIEVAGLAADGEKAAELLRQGNIDVVVLDVEMPLMDGMTALPVLLRIDPTVRVIMASALTTLGGAIAMQALQAGAADYVPKPAVNQADEFAREILAKVKGQARLRRLGSLARVARTPAAVSSGPARQPAPASSRSVASSAAPGGMVLRGPPARPPLLLAIGSSTGGPQALFTLFRALGAPLPVPVIVTQHMPPLFTRSLAEHIHRLGSRSCKEAAEDDILLPDHILIAPGNRHLTIRSSEQGLRARITDDPQENSCRPSVDPMLRSASAACGGRVLTVILTGMGQDGLRGSERVLEDGGCFWLRTRPAALSGACRAPWHVPVSATRCCPSRNLPSR